jgi:hypothetical protein
LDEERVVEDGTARLHSLTTRLGSMRDEMVSEMMNWWDRPEGGESDMRMDISEGEQRGRAQNVGSLLSICEIFFLSTYEDFIDRSAALRSHIGRLRAISAVQVLSHLRLQLLLPQTPLQQAWLLRAPTPVVVQIGRGEITSLIQCCLLLEYLGIRWRRLQAGRENTQLKHRPLCLHPPPSAQLPDLLLPLQRQFPHLQCLPVSSLLNLRRHFHLLLLICLHQNNL